jgi:hypothetical protein
VVAETSRLFDDPNNRNARNGLPEIGRPSGTDDQARVQRVVVFLRLDDLSVAHDEQDLHLRDVIPAVRAAGGPVAARDPKGPVWIDTVESLRRLAVRQILGLPQPGIARELSH